MVSERVAEGLDAGRRAAWRSYYEERDRRREVEAVAVTLSEEVGRLEPEIDAAYALATALLEMAVHPESQTAEYRREIDRLRVESVPSKMPEGMTALHEWLARLEVAPVRRRPVLAWTVEP